MTKGGPMTPFRLSMATIVGVILIASFASHARTAPKVVTDRSFGTVRSGSSMLDPRSGHSATLLPDGTVLIAGGMRRNQDFYRSAEIFDPATNQFSQTGDMSIARVGHEAVLLSSGKVLMLGGWIGRTVTDSVEEYDPTTKRFVVIGKMTTKRAHPSATLLGNGDVLIAGGIETDGRDGLATAEIYHAATRTFEALPSMH